MSKTRGHEAWRDDFQSLYVLECGIANENNIDFMFDKKPRLYLDSNGLLSSMCGFSKRGQWINKLYFLHNCVVAEAYRHIYVGNYEFCIKYKWNKQ